MISVRPDLASGPIAHPARSAHQHHRTALDGSPGHEPGEVGSGGKSGAIERDRVRPRGQRAVDQQGHLLAAGIEDSEACMAGAGHLHGDRGGAGEGVRSVRLEHPRRGGGRHIVGAEEQWLVVHRQAAELRADPDTAVVIDGDAVDQIIRQAGVHHRVSGDRRPIHLQDATSVNYHIDVLEQQQYVALYYLPDAKVYIHL